MKATSEDAAPPSPSASAVRLVVAAERLFALHGIDGVSLRQIGTEAGSGNNSAVHYHFGSKAGLIRAIFGHRLSQIIRERQLLATRGDPHDVRSRFEAHYLPVFAMAEAPDNRYVSFVEQLQRHEASGRYFTSLPEELRRSNTELHSDLGELLAHLDEPLRTMRIIGAQSMCLHAAADREHAVASGAGVPRFELFVSSLLDGATGFLAAPPSPATMRHLRDIDEATHTTLGLL